MNLSSLLQEVEGDQQPQNEMRNVLKSIGRVQDKVHMSLGDILLAMAEGYSAWSPSGMVLKIVGYMCTFLTPAGALIVISMGSLLLVRTAVKNASTVWSKIKSLAGFFAGSVAGLVGGAPAQAGVALLRDSGTVFRDATSDASPIMGLQMLETGLIAALPGPFGAAITFSMNELGFGSPALAGNNTGALPGAIASVPISSVPLLSAPSSPAPTTSAPIASAPAAKPATAPQSSSDPTMAYVNTGLTALGTVANVWENLFGDYENTIHDAR